MSLVQILDKTVYISVSANAPREGMNQSLLPMQLQAKLLYEIGYLVLIWQPV